MRFRHETVTVQSSKIAGRHGEDYQEFQEAEGNRIDINSYRLGRMFSVGVKVRF